jgi:hypothetical protein
VVKVVADRLQRDTERKLHHLLLFAAGCQKLLNRFVFPIAAFANKFPHQAHQGVELDVWNRQIVVSCCDNFNGRVEEALCDL